MPGTVLLITSDGALRRQVASALEAIESAFTPVADAAEATDFLSNNAAELVVCDFPTFDQLRQQRPGLCTVLIADAGDAGQTIEAMKRGALDCLVRPLRHEDLVHRLREAIRLCRDAQEPVRPKERKAGPLPAVRLVGQSPAMQQVYKQIGLLAGREINVLITGESGTGKELVARSLHEHSGRAGKPFMAVNCAAIPETLLESELFGHERGAFTGAEKQRIGRFEECHGGTLFLDEVGDMPASTQAKLLRVLQDGAVQRLGGNTVVKVDVRILAATHQPLEQMVAEKRFRQDLFYRLKVATIDMPPLREREVDAVLLAHHFVDRLYHQGQTAIRGFAPEAVSALLAYPWPGNVRELENVIKAAAVVARGTVFRPEFLPPQIAGGRGRGGAKETAGGSGPVSTTGGTSLRELARAVVVDPQRRGAAFADAVGGMEKAVILAALEHVGGRATVAAELLGISRTTLRKKMAEHQIVVRLQADAV